MNQKANPTDSNFEARLYRERARKFSVAAQKIMLLREDPELQDDKLRAQLLETSQTYQSTARANAQRATELEGGGGV